MEGRPRSSPWPSPRPQPPPPTSGLPAHSGEFSSLGEAKGRVPAARGAPQQVIPQDAYNARGLPQAPDPHETGNVIFLGRDPHGRGAADPQQQFEGGVPYEVLLFR